MKAATNWYVLNYDIVEFQSTPPVKAATYAGLESTIAGWISIHAAREGGDKSILSATATGSAFQSTPPVKAATDTGGSSTGRALISIHAAREGGDQSRAQGARSTPISIHAAREGGD